MEAVTFPEHDPHRADSAAGGVRRQNATFSCSTLSFKSSSPPLGLTARRRPFRKLLVFVVVSCWSRYYCCHGGSSTGDASHVTMAEAEVEVSTDGTTAITAASAGTTSPSLDEGSTRSSSSSSPPPVLECGIWIAPSSLPDTGLGMYAGKDFEHGAELLSDIAIPIVDIRFHLRDPEFGYLWDSYVWNGEGIDMEREGHADINYASPGFGSVANSFLPLQNVQQWDPDWVTPHDLHRTRDPGAGAFTSYGNRRSTALRDVAAGEELFVSYGEDWFIDREYLGLIPLTDDLNRATTLARAYWERRNGSDAAAWDDVWQAFVASRRAMGASSRVLAAFNHSDPLEWEHVKAGKTLTEIRTEQSRRDDAWLREHGVCGDHLTARPSTLPQAGHGAFARRDLPRGTTVASLPLVHVPDRSVLRMYPVERNPETGKPEPRPDRGVAGEQILVNYCLGHRDSTLLLCPYGPQASYVNHNQTQANVELVWSDPKRGNHRPDYLEMPLEQLIDVTSSKLALDVVATRDIREGEEVFLDYGDEWEVAWQRHVRNWEPAVGAASYRDGRTLSRGPETEPLPTEPEVLHETRLGLTHSNVELWCSDAYMFQRWKDFYPNRLEDLQAPFSHRCDILRRTVDDAGNYRYTAVMWTDESDTETEGDDEEEGDGERVPARVVGKLVDVPRQAFQYRDRPYTTDMFLPNAFRHDIRIPDHLFPEVWQNRVYLEKKGVDAFFF